MTNLEKLTTIKYEDASKRLAINVISNDSDLFAIWIQEGKTKLEVHISKSQEKIIQLEGDIGEAINKANISEELKIERCLEAINNGLWDFYHPKLDQRKVQP